MYYRVRLVGKLMLRVYCLGLSAVLGITTAVFLAIFWCGALFFSPSPSHAYSLFFSLSLSHTHSLSLFSRSHTRARTQFLSLDYWAVL